MAVVVDRERRRVYLPPIPEHEEIATQPMPENVPDTNLPNQALGFRVQAYGMTRHCDLFTPRQLTTLTTFNDLILELRDKVFNDSLEAGIYGEERLEAGGIGARAYTDVIAIYLSLAISRWSDLSNSLCSC
jgi:putative DNA methylase